MKEELRSDGDLVARQAWTTARNELLQLRQPAPPLQFPREEGIFLDLYAQVGEEVEIISPQFTCAQQKVSMRRRKKRKQADDGAQGR